MFENPKWKRPEKHFENVRLSGYVYVDGYVYVGTCTSLNVNADARREELSTARTKRHVRGTQDTVKRNDDVLCVLQARTVR